jgi:hypothetical protein
MGVGTVSWLCGGLVDLDRQPFVPQADHKRLVAITASDRLAKISPPNFEATAADRATN